MLLATRVVCLSTSEWTHWDHPDSSHTTGSTCLAHHGGYQRALVNGFSGAFQRTKNSSLWIVWKKRHPQMRGLLLSSQDEGPLAPCSMGAVSILIRKEGPYLDLPVFPAIKRSRYDALGPLDTYSIGFHLILQLCPFSPNPHSSSYFGIYWGCLRYISAPSSFYLNIRYQHSFPYPPPKWTTKRNDRRHHIAYSRSIKPSFILILPLLKPLFPVTPCPTWLLHREELK